MDKKLIEEQTSLALFEGAIKEDHCHYMIPDLNRIVWAEKMLYASDYNWLFRIVDMIETLQWVHRFEITTCSESKEYICLITEGIKDTFISIKTISDSRIEAIYKACVIFVEWYNTNLKENGSN